MYDLLKAQDHNLQIIRYQVSEIPELVRQLPERVDRLSAVFQGDWSPAKERWQKGVSSLSARQGESRYRLDDRLRIREDLRNRDAGAINRTLILIPDRTAPVDLSAIDPQKPPILG